MNQGNSRCQNSGHQFWGGFSFDVIVIGRRGPIYVKSTLFQSFAPEAYWLLVGHLNPSLIHHFRHFPWMPGRVLRWEGDFELHRICELQSGWRMVARWRASLLFVGNTINSPSKTGHLG